MVLHYTGRSGSTVNQLLLTACSSVLCIVRTIDPSKLRWCRMKERSVPARNNTMRAPGSSEATHTLGWCGLPKFGRSSQLLRTQHVTTSLCYTVHSMIGRCASQRVCSVAIRREPRRAFPLLILVSGTASKPQKPSLGWKQFRQPAGFLVRSRSRPRRPARPSSCPPADWESGANRGVGILEPTAARASSRGPRLAVPVWGLGREAPGRARRKAGQLRRQGYRSSVPFLILEPFSRRRHFLNQLRLVSPVRLTDTSFIVSAPAMGYSAMLYGTMDVWGAVVTPRRNCLLVRPCCGRPRRGRTVCVGCGAEK